MANTVQTVWKLVLDEQAAGESENAIQRLAGVVQKELGTDSTAAINKTTEAIKGQTTALKETEDQAKKTGKARSSGGNLPSAAKFRGAASLLGGSGLGELVGIVGDMQSAIKGISALGSAAGLAGVEGAAAAPGLYATAAGLGAMLLPLLPLIIAIGAVVAVLAVLKGADDRRAEDLKKQAELQRAISDEIAAGATKEDIEERIQALKDRDELETKNLAENKKAYDDYLESVRNAAGGLGRFLEPLIRLFGGEENQLAANIEESQKIIDDAIKKEAAYARAIERGDTAKNDAKKREEELADAREKTADETQKAADKALHDQEQADAKEKARLEKLQADEERFAEQQAAKEEQINKQRLDAGRKYSESLVDIARKTADDAVKALQSLQDTNASDTLGFQRDIHDLSTNFQASEREEALKRGEEEVNDLIQHGRKLASIRDEAFRSEDDLLKKRDFLGATRVREAANLQMEAENKALKDAQDDKARARQAEDSQQLRELDKARRDRLTALQRSNEDAKTAYGQALRDQRTAQTISIREAGIAHQRTLQQANEAARALLGIHAQINQGIVQSAVQALNGVRNMNNTINNTTNNTTNNNQRSVGAMNFNAQQIPNTQLKATVLEVLGQVGLA